MQIPKEAIEKAIEGKWQPNYLFDMMPATNYFALLEEDFARIALDPTFWQALGKALGWRTGMTFADIFDGRELSGWEYHAHRFYDLILQGKDTTDFWKEILN